MTVDPSQDPDRYDASRDEPVPPDVPAGPLDPSLDPDRFHSPTLPGLLGEGAHEEKRDTMTWVYGLLGVFAFLLLVSVLAHLGNPR
jgi:hypothetical protein